MVYERLIWCALLSSLAFPGIAKSDPIRLVANDPTRGAQFGYAVAVDEDVLVIGAPSESHLGMGAAYVFRRQGTSWVQEQKLAASSSSAPDAFGRSVAISGNWIVVGRPSWSFDGADVSGAVFYHFNGSAWVEEQEILVSSGHLGYSVAIHGSWAAVQFGIGGSIQLYENSGNTWIGRQAVSAELGPLDMDDERLVTRGNSSIHVYRRTGSTWGMEQQLTVPGLPASARFGAGSTLDGFNILVGATREENIGAVYWFIFESGLWTLHQHITPYGSIGISSEFGIALGMDGIYAVIGAPSDRGISGSAWGYLRCNDLLAAEQKWTPTQDQGLVGQSVAVQNGLAFVSAPHSSNHGEVYVFDMNVDCDGDDQPDGCSLLAGSESDCNFNLVLDDCEAPDDCNGNGLQDFCDIFNGSSEDCNHNQIPDECDVESGTSTDLDGDGIPDECYGVLCESPATPPTFSLMAVGRNGSSFAPRNNIAIRGNEIIDASLFVRCWDSELDLLHVYQIEIDLQNASTSGAFGRILPVGWDTPVTADPCPCEDPNYPICTNAGCAGLQHSPSDGLFIDVERQDFLFYGLSPLTAVDMSVLARLRFGGTTFGESAPDLGLGRYTGTLRLLATPAACGTFVAKLLSDTEPHSGRCLDYGTGLSSQDLTNRYCPAVENLSITVCEDDGVFCNGLETCDPDVGCRIIPPPSCDDGVACTVDTCDEAIDGCAHALNHGACDDGDVCTRDECTPGGCVNIDDLCGDIPAASHWGLAVLALCLLIAAKVRFRPRMV